MKAKMDDLTGRVFERLTVESYYGKKNGHGPLGRYFKHYWVCVCSCGKRIEVENHSLKSGNKRSCGCLLKDSIRAPKTSLLKHGMTNTPEFKVWGGMLNRCNNKNSKDYPKYGEKGIKVSDEWRDFKTFYTDMGPRPEGDFSIERKDNTLGYCKENCKWGTLQEQNDNRSNRVVITVDGESNFLTYWSDKYGITRNTIRSRLKHGWSPEEAVKTPTYTLIHKEK